MSKRNDWTDTEQQAICTAYCIMLQAQQNGTKFNKSAIRRELRAVGAPLANRSNGSVEAKLMNVSAAALAIGLPIVKGYKPATNYQASLRVHLQEAWQTINAAAGDMPVLAESCYPCDAASA